MADENPQTPPVVDDEYKNAIQPVVDNNMRTDILGPHFCKVLENHTPASKAITDLITKEIGADPALKKAVKDVVVEHYKETKMQWFDRGLGAFGVILVALIIWGLQRFLSGSIPPTSTLTPTPSPTTAVAKP